MNPSIVWNIENVCRRKEVLEYVGVELSGVRLCVCLALAAVLDGDWLGCGSALGSHCFHLLHHVHPLHHRSKHHVLSVQPCCLGSAEEELRAIGVLASVSHRQDSGSGVLEGEVLVGELVPVDRLAPCAVALREVAPLAHEARNDAVELARLEPKPLLSRAQRAEVLASFWNNIAAQLHDDASGGRAPDVNVKEATSRHLRPAQRSP